MHRATRENNSCCCIGLLLHRSAVSFVKIEHHLSRVTGACLVRPQNRRLLQTAACAQKRVCVCARAHGGAIGVQSNTTLLGTSIAAYYCCSRQRAGSIKRSRDRCEQPTTRRHQPRHLNLSVYTAHNNQPAPPGTRVGESNPSGTILFFFIFRFYFGLRSGLQ